jgi:sugar phosphate permease
MPPLKIENHAVKAQRWIKSHLVGVLGGAGLVLALVGIFSVTGWLRSFFLVPAGMCFVVGRWLAYMKDAGPD